MGDVSKMLPYHTVVVSSAARTATGNSGDLSNTAQSLPMYAATIKLQLVVSAASGTSPTLDVTLEDTVDGGTTWMEIGHFTQATAASQFTAVFRNWLGAGDAAYEAAEDIAAGTFVNMPIAQSHRIVWTIGGTNPSFTFTVLSTSIQAF